MKKIIKYKHFRGRHCETNATGNLLSQKGIHLSEPMLFGLGEGFHFLFLNLSSFNLPFLAGRSKSFELTRKLCKNLDVSLYSSETSSKKKAHSELVNYIVKDQCVGLQLDSYYLDYFSVKIHFASHFISVYGIENNFFLVNDTKRKGSDQKVSFLNMEKARHAKGTMSAKARLWTLDVKRKKEINLKKAIIKAIKNNSVQYLHPKFKGMGSFGIEKLARSLPKWIQKAKSPHNDLMLSSLFMEDAGTGGSVFRNFYRDFLKEASEITDNKLMFKAYKEFKKIAKQWKNIAHLIEQTAQTLDDQYLKEASKIGFDLAKKERKTMSMLSQIR